MALIEAEWRNHALHREAWAEEHGQWIGLFDENAEPICDCPPIIEMNAPQSRNTPVSGSFKFPVMSLNGVLHPLARELLADNLGKIDDQGRMVFITDQTRFICVERTGGTYNAWYNRRFFKVTHTVASGGDDLPAIIEVHAVDELSTLQEVPCPSSPFFWKPRWSRFTRDWAGPENVGITFTKPRDLLDIKMITVADGGTVEGKAETIIREIITESLEAMFKVMGVSLDNAPVAVQQLSDSPHSPNVLIRPSDESLWDTIGQIAQQAGVNIRARMWLPGDTIPVLVGNRRPTMPTLVLSVLQG